MYVYVCIYVCIWISLSVQVASKSESIARIIFQRLLGTGKTKVLRACVEAHPQMFRVAALRFQT